MMRPVFPDDWRYAFIEDSVDALAEHEDTDSARCSLAPDVYTEWPNRLAAQPQQPEFTTLVKHFRSTAISATASNYSQPPRCSKRRKSSSRSLPPLRSNWTIWSRAMSNKQDGSLTRPARFPLGQVVATANAAARPTSTEEVMCALRRHTCGDWGDLPPEDALANDAALRDGDRLLSAYGQGATPFGLSPRPTARSPRSCCQRTIDGPHRRCPTAYSRLHCHRQFASSPVIAFTPVPTYRPREPAVMIPLVGVPVSPPVR